MLVLAPIAAIAAVLLLVGIVIYFVVKLFVRLGLGEGDEKDAAQSPRGRP